MKYKLSIIVITMNRARQLANAINSCINCKLPDSTEFIIIDNASTDNTEETVLNLFCNINYPYKYIKEEKNKGVGGGRNIGYENAEGEFCYFLDDDAIIAPDCYDKFFMLPIEIFERDKRISSITTRIYDEAKCCDRIVAYSKIKSLELPAIFMYLGGSHFLRSEHYDKPLYIDIKYGFEEIIPSIYTIDSGRYNCYVDSIHIIHQPENNKWVKNTDILHDIICSGDANMLASKSLIYPLCMQPLLKIAFIIRLFKHFGFKLTWHKIAWNRYKSIKYKKKLRKISYKTIYTITKDYSFSSTI